MPLHPIVCCQLICYWQPSGVDAREEDVEDDA